ncbi:metallophosphoesterase [Roseobacter sp. MH60115]|uniref:metallophosphoesterase n=1 Tax=Roseobacter sp. MH60115 TaxID=2785324 RepID=UPI0018A328A7|nr:metallophosphoesterase [Roseobacter sp. MH60115]
MKLLFLSDLHDDFWVDADRDPFEGIEDQIGGLDHLLIAGDLTNKPKVRWKYAFERLSKLLPLERVSIFPGNHGFYDFRLDGEDRLEQIASAFGVGYVQKKQLVFGDTRVLCATLCTDFELGAGRTINESHASARMNDFRHIRVASKGYRKLRPSDLVLAHRNQLDWLSGALGEDFDGQTFVATHHAPHPSVLENQDGNIAAAYASDLSEIILKHRPERWFFGHCHGVRNSSVGDTQLINVSLGYPDEIVDPAARIRDLIFEI